ncbi:hypothetical protein KSS87_021988 [Heliosperma pusillum]|nr:hypothetical protein KSS87_021988 [Heliosperma pusillum]
MRTYENIQIKSMRLKHTCQLSSYNRKVSSEYLAEKYLEWFRTNIDWSLKKFQEQVLRDLNVHVSYGKCWLARSREKLVIFGNGKDQYGKVWDYAASLRKYNSGSTAFVVCDNIERPPPIFRRIYICLAACKEGFTKGCRPLLGVDGCHLKGPYPGMILVAVGKDENNNIFPVAWAVVEVENTDSWRWFLEMLANDVCKPEGEGMTFMSDRQKGLIDALRMVVPKAETRYCARHIWANFKLSYGGKLYKESFWNAVRATTKADFDGHMEGIKFLSYDAWAYLNVIPVEHWSRHAFQTHCKSNMLLNNLCETFNAVLKDARDKPILTQMEWIRRYVMKRTCEKREGLQKYEGRLMPYVNKYLKWAADEATYGKALQSKDDNFEVDFKGERWVVQLNQRKCNCRNCQLSGLPCTHAMVCILKQRLDHEDFVDDAYTKERYAMAYELAISPMPGVKQWEKSGLPEPLPPIIRKMRGRPSKKRRRKEAGEEESNRVKRPKNKNKCGIFGGLGHSKRTCKNPPAPPKVNSKGGRPLSKSSWAKEGRDRASARNAVKAVYATAGPPPSTSNVQSQTSFDVTQPPPFN